MEKSKHKEKKALSELTAALADCRDNSQITDFLNSLLTPTELKEIALRWALVKMLMEGSSQRKIAKDLNLSLCKITRGSRELKKSNSPFAKMVKLYDSREINSQI